MRVRWVTDRGLGFCHAPPVFPISGGIVRHVLALSLAVGVALAPRLGATVPPSSSFDSTVGPPEQSIAAGAVASWSGEVTFSHADHGRPYAIAWDFDGDGEWDHVPCDGVAACAETCVRTAGVWRCVLGAEAAFEVPGEWTARLRIDTRHGPGRNLFEQTFAVTVVAPPSGFHSTVAPPSQATAEGGAASWNGRITWSPASNGPPTSLAWDFENDGAADLALCGSAADCATHCSPPTTETFRELPTTDYPSEPAGSSVQQVRVADLDGDGDLDLVTSQDSSFVVRLNDGGGRFGEPSTFAAPSARIAVADFSGDGRADVVVSDVFNGRVVLFVNDGTGLVFTNGGVQSVVYSAWNLETADLNADGAADLIASGLMTPSVAVLLGDGAGGFTRLADVDAGDTWPDIGLADLDGDGATDLALTRYNHHQIRLLRGNGDGTFTFVSDIASGAQNAKSLTEGDIDGDGDVDLVVAHASSGTNTGILLLPNEGGFAFGPPVLQEHSSSDEMSLRDLDGDGHLDLWISYAAFFGVRRGNGTFTLEPAEYTFANSPSHHLGDLDGDGRFDLALSRGGNNRTSIFLNDGRLWVCPADASTTYAAAGTHVARLRLETEDPGAGFFEETREVVVGAIAALSQATATTAIGSCQVAAGAASGVSATAACVGLLAVCLVRRRRRG